jgi:hypothetical protein
MAVIKVFDITGATEAQYVATCDKLTGGNGVVRKKEDWPVPGLISHAAGPTDDGWLVVDVWESDAAFEAFGGHLGPIMTEVGMPPTEPRSYDVFNVVT